MAAGRVKADIKVKGGEGTKDVKGKLWVSEKIRSNNKSHTTYDELG